ncbi:MAG: DUF3037 domain-containing protein [Ginsengibacter sp.]
MQEKDLFEYAVIRVVPRVEREEFLNVGVVLYCAKQKFLQMLYRINEERVGVFCSGCDVAAVKEHLEAFERICSGKDDAGSIGKLPIAERFRWLTATRSTVVQTSKVHPGFCKDAGDELDKLFSQLVD